MPNCPRSTLASTLPYGRFYSAIARDHPLRYTSFYIIHEHLFRCLARVIIIQHGGFWLLHFHPPRAFALPFRRLCPWNCDVWMAGSSCTQFWAFFARLLGLSTPKSQYPTHYANSIWHIIEFCTLTHRYRYNTQFTSLSLDSISLGTLSKFELTTGYHAFEIIHLGRWEKHKWPS